MTRQEGVSIRQLGLPVVVDLLKSAEAFHRANSIPIDDAIWFSRSRPNRMTLTMRTASISQGRAGFCHGGFTAGLVDDMGGTASSIWAAQRGLLVWTKELQHVRYIRPLRVDTQIRVVATVKKIGRRSLLSCVNIWRDSDGKSIADGRLLLQLVDEIR